MIDIVNMENIEAQYLVSDLDLDYQYKLYKNVIIMMKKRGYIPKFKPLSKDGYVSSCLGYMINMQTVHDYLDKLTLFFKDKNTDIITMVYFHVLNINFNKQDMDYILNFMEQKKVDKLIIIIHDKITSVVTNTINILKDKAQVFNEDELIINITEHAFVPKHIKLNNDEKEELLSYYNASEKQIPVIYLNDPVVKYYNWNIGDLIRIERYNGTPHPSIYYRIVG